MNIATVNRLDELAEELAAVSGVVSDQERDIKTLRAELAEEKLISAILLAAFRRHCGEPIPEFEALPLRAFAPAGGSVNAHSLYAVKGETDG